MSITRYKNAKSIALSVALMLATSSMLTGCSSTMTPEKVSGVEVIEESGENSNSSQTGEIDDLTLDDLYVQSNDSYINYREYAQVNDIDTNTNFFYKDSQTGEYKEWTPKLEDWNYLQGLDDEDGSDVYVQESSGSVMPYFMWWGLMSASQRSNMAFNNVNFVTPTANGSYSAYKPSTAELSQIKEGKFVGKTPNRPAVNAASVNGTGTVSSLSKSTSGITRKSTTTTPKTTSTTSTTTAPKTTGTTSTAPKTTTSTTGTKSTTTTGTTSTTTTGTTGKSTSVTGSSTSTGGNTTSFGGSTTRSGGGTTSTGG